MPGNTKGIPRTGSNEISSSTKKFYIVDVEKLKVNFLGATSENEVIPVFSGNRMSLTIV